MRIVNLQEFLKLPANTVFAKYEPCVFGDMQIKGKSIGEIDFFVQELHDSIECSGSNELFDKLFDAQENGTSLKLDFDIEGRDGLYEKDQLYAVYEAEDIKGLIERLKMCLF